MKRFFVSFIVTWVVFATCSDPVQASAGNEVVQYQQGQLSVSFRDTPIRTVLEKVAAQVGIQFLLDPEIQSTVSIQFAALPLETALRRLLKNQSHALVHSPDKHGAFHVSQVKVFQKGHLAASRFELIGPGANQKASVSPSSGGSAAPQGAVTGSRMVEEGQGQTADKGNNTRINVHGVRGPAQVMEAIATTQAEMAMIQRKAAGEKQALEYEMARTRAMLASGQGDSRALVQKLDQLQQQEVRSERNNQAMLQADLDKMQQLQKDLSGIKTPAEELKEAQVNAIRQAAVMSSQVPLVEQKRRDEIRQKEINEARQKSELYRKQVQQNDLNYQQPARQSGRP